MSADAIIDCPNEYGPGIGEINGIYRKRYGECICAAHGETPCGYLKRESDQSVHEEQLSGRRAEDDTR